MNEYQGILHYMLTKTSTYGPRSCAGVNKLVLTASVVPWCNPDTQTIRTQAENVAVPFGLPAWFDWALV